MYTQQTKPEQSKEVDGLEPVSYTHLADMMRDIELHFAYRARQEKKKIILSGSD